VRVGPQLGLPSAVPRQFSLRVEAISAPDGVAFLVSQNEGIVTPDHFTGEPRRSAPTVGRNDQCPCGSRKKYKKCCGGATVN
jgi:hypothetical protein